MDGDKAYDQFCRKKLRLNEPLWGNADPRYPLCTRQQQIMRRDHLLYKLKQKRKYDPRRMEVRKQKSRMAKFEKGLQKAQWKSERKCRAAKIQENKEAKELRKEFFRIRKHLPTSPDVCPLYNCLRPHLRKRYKSLQQQEQHTIRTSSRHCRNQGSPASVKSCASDQSVRSRSPIVFHESDY